MLEEAQRLKKAGVDMVIGWIETHGRKETEELIGDLEIVRAATGCTSIRDIRSEATHFHHQKIAAFQNIRQASAEFRKQVSHSKFGRRLWKSPSISAAGFCCLTFAV